jgi:hypothetical protein
MGMGEPLANYASVLAAVRRLTEPVPEGMGISQRSVTVSTVGLVPAIARLAAEGLSVRLAVSLHAPDDELRDTLVPVNRRWKVAEVLDAAWDYAAATGRRVSIEYALIKDINDQAWRADLLGSLLAGDLAHVNLIPLNPTPGSKWTASRPADQREFVRRLEPTACRSPSATPAAARSTAPAASSPPRPARETPGPAPLAAGAGAGGALGVGARGPAGRGGDRRYPGRAPVRRVRPGSMAAFPPGACSASAGSRSATDTLIGAFVSLSAGMVPGQDLGPVPVLQIGDRCVIGRGSHIVAHQSLVSIGDDVFTGPYVYITDQNHGYADPDVPIGRQLPRNAAVRIGSGSWLGAGAVVLPGRVHRPQRRDRGRLGGPRHRPGPVRGGRRPGPGRQALRAGRRLDPVGRPHRAPLRLAGPLGELARASRRRPTRRASWAVACSASASLVTAGSLRSAATVSSTSPSRPDTW